MSRTDSENKVSKVWILGGIAALLGGFAWWQISGALDLAAKNNTQLQVLVQAESDTRAEVKDFKESNKEVLKEIKVIGETVARLDERSKMHDRASNDLPQNPRVGVNPEALTKNN